MHTQSLKYVLNTKKWGQARPSTHTLLAFETSAHAHMAHMAVRIGRLGWARLG